MNTNTAENHIVHWYNYEGPRYRVTPLCGMNSEHVMPWGTEWSAMKKEIFFLVLKSCRTGPCRGTV